MVLCTKMFITDSARLLKEILIYLFQVHTIIAKRSHIKNQRQALYLVDVIKSKDKPYVMKCVFDYRYHSIGRGLRYS